MTSSLIGLIPAPDPLPDGSRVSQASFRVASLERTARFYTHVVGLDEVHAAPGALWLGAGETPFLELVDTPGAVRYPGRTGLYHLAILYPTRSDLAAVTQRLLGLGAPLQGASDHGVSEALYLADPEGNGLELYRDREASDWPVHSGRLTMDTQALDLDDLLATAPDPETWSTPPGTGIGHIHLAVTDVTEAETFYREVVGLDLMQRYGSSASFLSAGGYHHHVGVNSWQTRHAEAPPDSAAGLAWFRLDVPDASARERLLDRLRNHQVPHTSLDDGTVRFADPSGNVILV